MANSLKDAANLSSIAVLAQGRVCYGRASLTGLFSQAFIHRRASGGYASHGHAFRRRASHGVPRIGVFHGRAFHGVHLIDVPLTGNGP